MHKNQFILIIDMKTVVFFASCMLFSLLYCRVKTASLFNAELRDGWITANQYKFKPKQLRSKS